VANSTNTNDSSALEFALSSLCAASDEQFKSIPDDEIVLLAKKFHALHRFYKERRRSPRGCFECGDIYPTVIIGVGRSFELSRDERGIVEDDSRRWKTLYCGEGGARNTFYTPGRCEAGNCEIGRGRQRW
jgi:hypothetical protein